MLAYHEVPNAIPLLPLARDSVDLYHRRMFQQATYLLYIIVSSTGTTCNPTPLGNTPFELLCTLPFKLQHLDHHFTTSTISSTCIMTLLLLLLFLLLLLLLLLLIIIIIQKDARQRQFARYLGSYEPRFVWQHSH